VSAGRPPARLDGDWLVATMIYGSTREARVAGFDRWYWDVLALLPRAKSLLLVAGAYDSDNTIRELLDEAKRRGIPVTVHFIERGPLRLAFEQLFKDRATIVEDVETFAEKNDIALDGDDDLDLKF
jgi:hypothetical protein